METSVTRAFIRLRSFLFFYMMHFTAEAKLSILNDLLLLSRFQFKERVRFLKTQRNKSKQKTTNWRLGSFQASTEVT